MSEIQKLERGIEIEHKRFDRWFSSEERFLKTPVGIFLIGAFLGTLAPSPTDAVHFWLQMHVLSNPAYSVGTRAFLQVFDWYFLDSLYFFILLVIAYFLHVKKVATVKRVTLFGSIIAIGIVIGLLAQFLGA